MAVSRHFRNTCWFMSLSHDTCWVKKFPQKNPHLAEQTMTRRLWIGHVGSFSLSFLNYTQSSEFQIHCWHSVQTTGQPPNCFLILQDHHHICTAQTCSYLHIFHYTAAATWAVWQFRNREDDLCYSHMSHIINIQPINSDEYMCSETMNNPGSVKMECKTPDVFIALVILKSVSPKLQWQYSDPYK